MGRHAEFTALRTQLVEAMHDHEKTKDVLAELKKKVFDAAESIDRALHFGNTNSIQNIAEYLKELAS